MEIKVITQKNGLTVDFRNFTEVPSGNITYHWDFGDNMESSLSSPSHTYNASGIYEAKLDIIVEGEVNSYSLRVLVSDDTKITTLSDSIYNLIDKYIPHNIQFPFDDKRVYIEKWQLYLQPLVDHEITNYDFNNEVKYNALENQLIMEMAVIDFLITTYTNILQTGHLTGVIINNDSGVRKITTGPTEVEYFDDGELRKSLIDNALKALSKGGLIDTLKSNVCQLSERLNIYLPICRTINSNIVTPEVVYAPLKTINPLNP